MTRGGKRILLPLHFFFFLYTFNGFAFVSSSFVLNFDPFSSTTTAASTKRLSRLLSSNKNENEVVVEIDDKFRLWKGSVPQVQKVKAMPDPPLYDLKLTSNKQYYLLRHGQSTANVDEVISSDRTSLAYTNKHGLTELGYQQGQQAAQQLVDLLLLDENKCKPGDIIVFISSPFARARQTAQACLDALLQDETLQRRLGGDGKSDSVVTIVPDIYYHDLLLERSFGRLDNEAIYTYAYVWPLDKHDVLHTAFDVESVAAVCTRIHEFVKDLEQVQFPNGDHHHHDDKKNDNDSNNTIIPATHVVCVSHADVLQIAQLYAANVPNIGEFSSYRFANGEIRRMQFNGGVQSLPQPGPLQAPQRGTGM